MEAAIQKRWLRAIFIGILLYGVLLTILALEHEGEKLRGMFSEEGFFERHSITCWMIAALCALFFLRPWTHRNLVLGSLFCLCAMREADWHKKFTVDGILKINYYTKSSAPWVEKCLAGGVASLFLGLIAYSLWLGWQRLRVGNFFRDRAALLILCGAVLFFAGKILDRMASVLDENFGINLPGATKHFLSAYEEGYEMITPLMFALALLPMWRKEKDPKIWEEG